MTWFIRGSNLGIALSNILKDLMIKRNPSSILGVQVFLAIRKTCRKHNEQNNR